MEFVDGVDNDVVKVFLGTSDSLTGADLKLTANSWEDFYRDALFQPSPAVVGSLSRINGNPGGNTPAGIYLDDLTMTSGTTLFSNLGECISTKIEENCSGLTGEDRAMCNQEQQGFCFDLFDVP